MNKEELTQPQAPVFTCQEFCCLHRAPRASLNVFRRLYVTSSDLPENKDMKTKEEWIRLYDDFKNKR
jgi:hypothetical protein